MLWEQDGFALAGGYDLAAQRYVGLVLPSDEGQIPITDQTLVVRPDVATAQRAVETAEGAEGGRAAGDVAPNAPSDGADEILAHLASAPGATVKITLEIEPPHPMDSTSRRYAWSPRMPQR